MISLFLNYTDEDSAEQRVEMAGDRFVIGRHSDNDLCVVDSRLSRRHLQIERFADVFIASDLDSSNGTTLNGEALDEPADLEDGDVLDLGGGLEISVEFVSDQPASDSAGKEDGDGGSMAREPVSDARVSDSGESVFGNVMILGPLLGFGVLLIIGLVVLAVWWLGDGGKDSVAGRDRDLRFPTSTADLSEPSGDTFDTPATNGLESPEPTFAASTPESGATTVPGAGDQTDDESEKLRSNVIGFMRKIAQRDPNPVIISRPLSLIDSKIRRISLSPALAVNIRNARGSAARLRALSATKNLKPQFVAVAALAKLGTTRGDVYATAGGMIDVLGKLKIQIGDGFANESVIIVAAYDQGVRGEFLAMRDIMTKLARANPRTSSRKVRTLWFLKEKGKISDSQFDLALRFIAIGAISQNPRAFGVSADPLVLN